MRRYIERLFDWLERRLHTDVRYLAKGGTWLMSGQVVLAGFSLISAWVFANLLSQDTFGNYRFVLSILGILSLTTLSGMSTAVVRAASRGFSRTIYPIVRQKIQFGFIGLVCGLCVAGYYLYNENSTVGIAIALGSLFIPFKDTFSVFDAILQALRRFDLSTYYRVITQAVSLVCIIVALFLTQNLFLILFAYLGPLAIAQYIFYRRTIRQFPPEGGVDIEALRYGKHLSVLGTLSGFAGNFQNILLFHFLGAAPVAIFYFATAPTEQMRSITSQVEPILFPKIAKDEWHIESLTAFFKKSAPFLFIVTGGALLYIGLAPFLFSIFFPNYMNAVLYSQLYAPTIILTATNTLLMTIVKAKGLLKVQYVINGIETTFGIIISIFMLYIWGLYGLIASMFLMKATELIVMLWKLQNSNINADQEDLRVS